MKIVYTYIFLFLSSILLAQATPASRYYKRKGAFDRIDIDGSFGYSLRKLRNAYTGPAIRVRRTDVNAEADVAFDANGIVSDNSIVTITTAGVGYTLGQTFTLATFRIGVTNLRVTTWYDQSPKGYNATQTTTTAQPELLMNSAGPGNAYPSIQFTGNATAANRQFFRMNQTLDKVLGNGYLGSFMIVAKTTQNVDHFTFGYATTNWRWSFHINWSNGNAYFDSGENCCQETNRKFVNTANVNFNRQYTFVRRLATKLCRVNMINTINEISQVNATSPPSYTGTDFFIGSAVNNPNDSYYGTMNEVIMFPTDIALAQIQPIETNQMAFWGL